MIARFERGRRLYVADEPSRIFEGVLLDVDFAAMEMRLDPFAELSLDATTGIWIRTLLPRGRARVVPFAKVHDEKNETRHYALKGYTSPLGEPGTWAHPSKRVWTLTTGSAAPDAPVRSTSAMPAVAIQVFTTQPRRGRVASSSIATRPIEWLPASIK